MASSSRPVLYGGKETGFPSPADDYLEGGIDFNRLLVKRPAATFVMRVSGTSCPGEDLHDGDLVVVDRSRPPVPGDLVIAVENGELIIRRMPSGGRLSPGHGGRTKPFNAHTGDDAGLEVWGVVAHLVRSFPSKGVGS